MHDLTKPQKVLVKGRQVSRPATVNPEDHNEFCVASTREVIAHAHIKKMKPCSASEGVELTDTKAFEKYKQDIKNGIRRPECHKCWADEDQGFDSERIHGNRRWLDPWHGNSHTEIILSNNCNSSCIYCNSMWSSKWREDIANSKTPLPKSILDNHGSYFFDAHTPNKKEIAAAYNVVADVGKDFTKMACIGVWGGEPGLTIIEEDHVGNVLNTFFDNNEMWGRTIRYDFNTSLNYSYVRCKEIIRYFVKHKHTFPTHYPILQPSIESLGELFNYVRYGNDFERFDQNLDLFLQEEIFQVEFEVSLNSFVLKDLKNLIEYINNKAESTTQEVKIKFRMVNWLPIFHLSVLDKTFLPHVDEAIEYVEKNEIHFKNSKEELQLWFSRIKKQLNSGANSRADEALDFCKWIESERNLKLQDVNPELYNYFVKMSSN